MEFYKTEQVCILSAVISDVYWDLNAKLSELKNQQKNQVYNTPPELHSFG